MLRGLRAPTSTGRWAQSAPNLARLGRAPAVPRVPAAHVDGVAGIAGRLGGIRFASNPAGRELAEKSGLYRAATEKDSCGVGLVANIKGKAQRDIVAEANTLLVRMAHRGGCGCEPNTGDGAGSCLAVHPAGRVDAHSYLGLRGGVGVWRMFL
jgi:hypothetical protein